MRGSRATGAARIVERVVLIGASCFGAALATVGVAFSPIGIVLGAVAPPVLAACLVSGTAGSTVLAVRRQRAARSLGPPAGADPGGRPRRLLAGLHLAMLPLAVPVALLVGAARGLHGPEVLLLVPAGPAALAGAVASVVLTWRSAMDGDGIRREVRAAARAPWIARTLQRQRLRSAFVLAWFGVLAVVSLPPP